CNGQSRDIFFRDDQTLNHRRNILFYGKPNDPINDSKLNKSSNRMEIKPIVYNIILIFDKADLSSKISKSQLYESSKDSKKKIFTLVDDELEFTEIMQNDNYWSILKNNSIITSKRPQHCFRLFISSKNIIYVATVIDIIEGEKI